MVSLVGPVGWRHGLGRIALLLATPRAALRLSRLKDWLMGRHAKARNVPEDKRDTFGYGDVWTWTVLD